MERDGVGKLLGSRQHCPALAITCPKSPCYLAKFVSKDFKRCLEGDRANSTGPRLGRHLALSNQTRLSPAGPQQEDNDQSQGVCREQGPRAWAPQVLLPQLSDPFLPLLVKGKVVLRHARLPGSLSSTLAARPLTAWRNSRWPAFPRGEEGPRARGAGARGPQRGSAQSPAEAGRAALKHFSL